MAQYLPAQRPPAPAVATLSAPAQIHRCGGVQCPPGICNHDDDPKIHRHTEGVAQIRTAPDLVTRVLSTAGEAMSTDTRSRMESRFGHDFSRVRIHTNAEAAKSAVAIQARAYTFGRHIVMGPGRYRPETQRGAELLVHELTHVVQQGNPASDAVPARTISHPHDPAEQEAHRLAGAMIGQTVGPAAPARLARPAVVARACQDGRWAFEYDGCSMPSAVVGVASGQRGARLDKDNPAGGRDTQFALGIPTLAGGVGCDRHDECYQSCGSNQLGCDTRMREDMLAICARSSEGDAVKASCREWAQLYYAALRRFGGATHAERQSSVCGCDPTSQGPAFRFPPRELLAAPRGSGRQMSWLDYNLARDRPPLSAFRTFLSQEAYEAYLRVATPSDAPHGNPQPR
jgi:hypothetical protein